MYVMFVTSGSSQSYIDFESGNLSGTESQIYGVAKELARRNHEVHIVRGGETFSESRLDNGIRVTDIAASTLVNSRIGAAISKVRFSRSVRDYMGRTDPDVVNVIMKYGALFTVKSEFPVVHFAFTNPSSLNPRKNPLTKTITGLVETHLVEHVDGIVVRNEITHGWASKHSDAITEQIPTAIDVKEYEDRQDGKFILYGGRFSSEKNVDHLVRAYSRLPDHLRAEYDLSLVGEGSQEDQLRDLVDELGVNDTVRFRPWLPDAEFREELGHATCAVLPSAYEGMPVFLIEAMGSGTPVIGTDIYGIRDLMCAGLTGLLFDPGDIRMLSEQLRTLLSDEEIRNSLVTNAREKVRENHSFEEVTSQYLSLYEHLLSDD